MEDKKKIGIVIGVVLAIFAVTVAWAVLTGTLTFNGTTHLATNVDLRIVDAEILYPEDPGDEIWEPPVADSLSVSTDGQTLTFTTNLENPGDYRDVEFYVQNFGNVDAKLGTLSITAPAAGSGLNITWPNLNNVVVPETGVGNPAGPYIIKATWISTASGAKGGTYSASITYAPDSP